MRKRLKPEESQRVALEAARDLLVSEGPQAVTLKAVAARIDRTHANLLHHFGSARGLQNALAGFLANDICEQIGEVVRQRRAGEASARDVVDMTFDAFGRRGGANLAIWMLASGEKDALGPIIERITLLVRELGGEAYRDSMRDTTQMLVLMAIGDALTGNCLADSLDIPKTRAREIAAEQMQAMLRSSDEATRAA